MLRAWAGVPGRAGARTTGDLGGIFKEKTSGAAPRHIHGANAGARRPPARGPARQLARRLGNTPRQGVENHAALDLRPRN
jgi:hypothetical protein